MNLNQVVAGVGAGQVEIVERARPVEGDRDSIFKSALVKSHETPRGSTTVTKAQDGDTGEVDLTRPDACAALIRRAHSTGAATWEPFAASQDLAKSASIAAGGGRVVRVFREGGETRFVVEHA